MSDFKDIIGKVQEFHEVFGLDHNVPPSAHIGEDKIALRHRLMAEENDEYLEAARNNDLTLVADALGISCIFYAVPSFPMDFSIRSSRFSRKYTAAT